MDRKLVGKIVFGIAIAVFILLTVASYALVGRPGQLNPIWTQQHAK